MNVVWRSVCMGIQSSESLKEYYYNNLWFLDVDWIFLTKVLNYCYFLLIELNEPKQAYCSSLRVLLIRSFIGFNVN